MIISNCLGLNHRFISTLFSWICLLVCAFLQGQSSNEISSFYSWFDNVFGIENTDLYNGVEYIPKYLVVDDNHPFFDSADFVKGTLLYNKQFFYDVPIKYDIYEDEVLLNVEYGFGKGVIKTIRNKLDKFWINNHSFIKIKNTDRNSSPDGFFEELLVLDGFKLYKKHVSKKGKISKDSRLYSQFYKGNEWYCLQFNNIYYEIRKVKDIISIFPEYKKEINKYYKKPLDKSGQDAAFMVLIRRIHQLYLSRESILAQ
ncbi:MAG: hypothetical protein WBN63_00845 [Eudoraea sp.]|uniref:hypothetical protein n=1 Tax=Eudoraea sp. TaxID=1979955 RepID=UPI003C762FA7